MSLLLLLLLHSGFRQPAGVGASDPGHLSQLASDWSASALLCSDWLTRDMTLTHSNHQRLWAGSCDSEQVS